MNNPPELKTAETLRLAASIIRHDGLCKNAWRAGEAVCTNGAICKAVGLEPYFMFAAASKELRASPTYPAVQALASFIVHNPKELDLCHPDIMFVTDPANNPCDATNLVCCWNNGREQTAKNVVATMERVALELERMPS